MSVDAGADVKLERLPAPLRAKVDESLLLIRGVLTEFGRAGVALAFNGGKDAVVVLHLVAMVLRDQSERVVGDEDGAAGHAGKEKSVAVLCDQVSISKLRSAFDKHRRLHADVLADADIDSVLAVEEASDVEWAASDDPEDAVWSAAVHVRVALSTRGGPTELLLEVAIDGGVYSVLSHAETPPRQTFDLLTVYFENEESFQEERRFAHQMKGAYSIPEERWMTCSDGFKVGLQNLVDKSGIRAVFMGTRSTDPYSEHLEPRCMTDEGWPKLLRVLPLLNWTYHDVWEFIQETGVPYCELYDRGYTSIGSMSTTSPNPALKDPSGKFRPAHELKDASLERAGRISSSAKNTS